MTEPTAPFDPFIAAAVEVLRGSGVDETAVVAVELKLQQLQLTFTAAPVGTKMLNSDAQSVDEIALRVLNPEGTPIWRVIARDGAVRDDMQPILPGSWTEAPNPEVT